MRYFTVQSFDDKDFYTETLSEDDIRKEYYPYWYDKMCKAFGQETVDAKYSFEDCLDDWVITNWATEVDG
jgi:hypothetical protein